jgi:hypothetical protein
MSGSPSAPPQQEQAGVLWTHRFGSMRIEVIDGVCFVDGRPVIPVAM